MQLVERNVAVIAFLTLASTVLSTRNAGWRAALRPEPVTIGIEKVSATTASTPSALTHLRKSAEKESVERDYARERQQVEHVWCRHAQQVEKMGPSSMSLVRVAAGVGAGFAGAGNGSEIVVVWSLTSRGDWISAWTTGLVGGDLGGTC